MKFSYSILTVNAIKNTFLNISECELQIPVSMINRQTLKCVLESSASSALLLPLASLAANVTDVEARVLILLLAASWLQSQSVLFSLDLLFVCIITLNETIT